jgi:isoleucyl-tRNA synthetase
LGYRTQVQGVLEISRREKTIGSSLEAAVEIRAEAEEYAFLKTYERDLPALFIVSQVRLTRGDGGPVAVVATKSSFGKCERCWNFREAVGANSAHPTLCDRCVEAIQ